MNKILIIKHGSYGDIIFSLPVLYSIKFHYKNSKIDLLTGKNFFDLFDKANFFDEIIFDSRSRNIFITFSLLFSLLKKKYDLIIDLQTISYDAETV